MYNLSISIVTYNNENTISNTLNSIINNMDSNIKYTIYIIDNGSSDKTLEKIRDISYDIVVIQNKKNVGFGAAHNIVLDRLDSDYHIAINPDIEIVNNCIYEMCNYMSLHPEIGLLTPQIKFNDGRTQYLCKRNPTVLDLFLRFAFAGISTPRQKWFEMRETGYNKEFEVEYATGCFMFFRTDILKQLNGFDEGIFLYLEDADITRRVNQVSKTMFFPYNYVVHEWQRGSHKSLKLILINIQSAVYYFRKWGFKLF